MKLSLLPEADSLSAHLLEPGTCLKLLAKGAEAEALRSSKNYGCRHCIRKLSTSSSGSTDEDGEPGSTHSADTPGSECLQTTSPDKQRLFNFNGLRSHLKAKSVALLLCMGVGLINYI